MAIHHDPRLAATSRDAEADSRMVLIPIVDLLIVGAACRLSIVRAVNFRRGIERPPDCARHAIVITCWTNPLRGRS
jgi:hypothetical protein